MVVAHASKNLANPVKNAREAQRMAVQYSRPLADVTDLINENIAALQRQTCYLESRAMTMDEIDNNLYVPKICLQVIEMKHPITVCTSAQCCEVYSVSLKTLISKFLYRCSSQDKFISPSVLFNI